MIKWLGLFLSQDATRENINELLDMHHNLLIKDIHAETLMSVIGNTWVKITKMNLELLICIVKKDFFLKEISYAFQGVIFASKSLENYMEVVSVDIWKETRLFL